MGIVIELDAHLEAEQGLPQVDAQLTLCQRPYAMRVLAAKYSVDNVEVRLPRLCNLPAGHRHHCCDHQVGCSCTED